MASLTWTWTDYWTWFEQLETDEERTIAMRELLGNGWLVNLSAQIQAEVMRDAPQEIRDTVKLLPHIFKAETHILIEYMRRNVNKGKRK